MFVLKAKEKPRWARRNSDDFYYRDRGRVDCEGIDKATRFENYEEAVRIANKFGYEVEEIFDNEQ